MRKKIGLSDITMFDLANGIEGVYKGSQIAVSQVGRCSYLVTINGLSSRVAGIGGVKELMKGVK